MLVALSQKYNNLMIVYKNKVAAGGTANGVTTGAIDTTGADCIFAAVGYYAGGSGPTMSDSKTNSWSSIRTRVNNNIVNRLYRCLPSSVGTGHTFTFSGTGVYPAISILAFSGVKQTTPDDQFSDAIASSASVISTGSITPSEDNEVLIACVGVDHGSTGPIPNAIDGGFTLGDCIAISSGACEGVGIGYLIQTSVAAANPQFTISDSSAYLAAIIASIFSAAGGGGPSRRSLTLLKVS